MVIFKEKSGESGVSKLQEAFTVATFVNGIASMLLNGPRQVRVEYWTRNCLSKISAAEQTSCKNGIRFVLASADELVDISNGGMAIYEMDRRGIQHNLLDRVEIISFSVSRAAVIFNGVNGAYLKVFTKLM